jgi:Mrp family chromosome partitioning ATPase/capsular polysaccharide biosynthesis protein
LVVAPLRPGHVLEIITLSPGSIIWTYRWLIGLVVVMSGAVTYVVAGRAQKVYSTSALTEVILSAEQSGQYVDPTTLQELTNIYLTYTTGPSALDAAVAEGHLHISPRDLRAHVVATVAQPGVLQITGRAQNATMAAQYANAVSAGFIETIQSAATSVQRTRLTALQARANQLQTELQGLHAGSPSLVPVQSSLTAAQAEIATILSTPSDTARVISSAQVSQATVSPRPKRDALLAAVLALLAMPGVCYLWFLWRGAYGSPEEAAQDLGLPLLGIIGRDSSTSPRQLEAVRAIRLAVEVAHAPTRDDGPGELVLITSPGAGAGKTYLTALLTRASVADGKGATFIDADLRRSTLAAVLDVTPGPGLRDILVAGADPRECLVHLAADDNASTTPVDFLGPGVAIGDPPELLASPRLRATLDALQAAGRPVYVDSPPVLAVSDPLLLSRYADTVVLVINAKSTRRREARQAVAKLRGVGAPLSGIVFNGSAPNARGAYYGDYYHELALST